MTESERKTMQNRIIGPVVPLNVPYKEDESIDYGALEKYVDFLADKGVPTLLFTYGSTEYANLNDEEIYELTKVVAKANAGRSVFVGATKAWSVKKSIEYLEFAQKCGAQSVKIQPPFFDGCINQDNLLDYYMRIDKASPLPLWAYSIPLKGVHPGIAIQTWRRIVEECTNVYAMKTDGDMIYGFYDLIQAAGQKVMVVSGGQMKTMIFGWPFGSMSYLCPIAPFLPDVSLRFIDYMGKGQTDDAIHIIHSFEDPMIGMCERIDWLTLIKAMLYCAGIFPTPRLRCPAYTANANEVVIVKELFQKLKILADQGF